MKTNTLFTYLFKLFSFASLLLFSVEPTITFPPIPISPSNKNSDLCVAFDSSGNMVAVWAENGMILSSDLPLHGSWSIPIILSNAIAEASSPRLEIDPETGETTVLWLEESQIKAICRSSGEDWTSATMEPTLLEAPSLQLMFNEQNEPIGIQHLPPQPPFDKSAGTKLAIGVIPNLAEEKQEGGIREKSRKRKKIPSGSFAPFSKKKGEKENKKGPLSTNAIDAPSSGSLRGGQIGFAAGTSAPSDGLIVSGNTYIGASSWSGKFGVVDSAGGFFFDGSGATYASANRFKSTTTSTGVGRDLVFVTDNAGTNSALYITTASYVGIASSTPQAPLQVSGTPGASGEGSVHIRPASGQAGYLTFSENGVANRGAIGFDAASGFMNFITNGLVGVGTTQMSIASTGGVEIGSGYAGITPPANGLIIEGKFAVGSSGLGSTTRARIVGQTSDGLGFQMSGTMGTTTAFITSNDIVGQAVTFTFQPSGTVNNVVQQYVVPLVNASLAASTTIPNSYGLYVAGGNLSAGTVTNAYGVYASNPSYGTNKAAIYGDNLSIGYTATTPPSSGAIIQGNVGIATTSATNALTIGSVNVAGGEYIRLNGTSANQSFMSVYANTTRVGYIGSGGAANGLVVNSDITNLILQTAGVPTYFTGQNLVGINGGLSIGGGYFSTLPPSNGAIIQGRMGLGVNSATYYLDLVPTSVSDGIRMKGAITNLQLILNNSSGTSGSRSFALTNNSGFPATIFQLLSDADAFSSNLMGVYSNSGLSIGSSYATTTPPSSGAIIQGILGVGTPSPDTNGTVNIQCGGTKTTTSGGFAYGIIETCTFTPTAGAAGDLRGISSQPTFNAPAGQTIAAAMGMFSSITPNTAGNTGSIITAYGMLISTGSAPASGTVGMGYGLYVFNPLYGNTKCATYTDNLSVGYSGTAPPSSGAIIQGSVGIGTSSPAALIKLQVGSTADTTANVIRVANANAANANPVLSFFATGAQENVIAFENGFLLFGINPASFSTANLQSAGKVAIGPSGGLCVGSSYINTTPPTNGAIVEGILGVGTASPDTNGTANIYCGGTKTTTSGGFAYSTILTTTFTPTAGAVGDLRGLSSQCTFNAPTGQTVAFAEGIFAYLTPNTTGNTGTITNAAGVYVAGGVAPASGTVSNGYGLFVENPAYGTVKCATYTNNLSVGYSGTAPPSSGAIIQGQVGIGTNSPGGYMFKVTVPDTTSFAIGGGVVGAMRGTTGLIAPNDQAAFYVACNLKPSGAINFAMQGYIYPQLDASLATATTIPDSIGLLIASGNLSSGTVTRAYGAYIANPSFGTSRCAIYTENLSVGYTGTSPPIGGAIMQGKLGVGQASVGSDRYIQLSPQVVNTASNFGVVIDGYLGSSSGTIGESTVLYVNGLFNQNLATIVNAYCMHVNGAVTAGTITNGFGMKIEPVSFGSTRYGLWVDAPASSGYTCVFGGSPTNIIIDSTGLLYPSTNKTVNIGGVSNRFNTIYNATNTTGTSRLGKSQVHCPSCSVRMVRGTGTLVVLGETADFVPCWCDNDQCPDFGHMHMDKLKHLSQSRLSERRAPPKIQFLGFKVIPHSGNSRGIQVKFRYIDHRGDAPHEAAVENSTYLTDVEFEEFSQMDRSKKLTYIQALGLREWHAMEEARLLNEECEALEIELNRLTSEWINTDLLKY